MRRSPWRSPLLILGIAVILAAAAALVAPLFITWSAWRGDIEAFAGKITGRDVRIEGEIDAVLFPWPRLTLGEVTVAGAPGGVEPWLLKAPRIDIALALPPLLSGEIEMTEVLFTRPEVRLERLASGGWNAAMAPDSATSGALDPARVSFPKIVVAGGALTVADTATGHRFTVPVVDATASAPGLAGPWRSTARLDLGGTVRVLSLATGASRPGEPLRLYSTLSPEPGVPGYSAAFDASFPPDDAPATGSLRLQSVAAADGRADPQFGFEPMALKADVEINGATVTLPKIEIAPAAAGEAANIIAGTGSVAIGERVAVSATLASPRIDLDRMIGLEKREAIASAGAIGVLADWASRLPASVDADVRLAVSSFAAGGETLDGAVVDVAAGRDGVRLDEFAISLPGQTRVTLQGRVAGVSPNATLDGRVKLSSGFLRDFVDWLSPAGADQRAAAWSGARGAFSLDGELAAGPGRIAVSQAAVALDETRGVLGLDYRAQPRPGLDLTLRADTLDPARYIPAARAFGPRDVIAVIPALAGDGADVTAAVQLDALTLNGETARRVALDVRRDAGGVDVRSLDLGDVDGGRLSVNGRIASGAGRLSGALKLDAAAADPRPLARFAGVAVAAGSRPWTAGPLVLSVEGEAKPDGEAATAVAVSGRGTLGAATAALTGRFTGGLDDWRNGTVDVTADGTSPSSLALAALLGIEAKSGASDPAKATLRVKGTPAKGLDVSLDAEGFAAAGQFQGRVSAGPGWRADGRLALLAPDSAPLLAALGIAPDIGGPASRFLSGEAGLEATPERVRFSGVSATVGGTQVKGDIAVNLNARLTLSGALTAGTADAAAIAGALLPGDGPPALDRPFGDLRSLGDIDLTLKAGTLALLPGVTVADAALTLTGKAGALAAVIEGRDETGKAASLSLEALPADQGLAVTARGTMGFVLADRLRQANGAPALSGTAAVAFEAAGEGLSAASVIAALEGKGTVALSDLTLAGVDPAGFAGGLAAAQTAADVDRLVDSTLRAGSIPVAAATVPLTIASGIASAGPAPVALESVTGALRLILDLAAGKADIAADLTLGDQGRAWPAFELAWSGPPGALDAVYDVAALKSAVGVEVLKRGVDQLEALQREQQRLAEEERAFARQQAIPYTEELTRRYLRARAAEAKAARDAIETRRQSEATAFRKAAEAARRAEEEARRKAEAEARRKAEEERQRLIPNVQDDGAQPLPFAPAPSAVPVPRAKPDAPAAADPAPAPQTATPAPIGTPAVVPPIPGEGDITIEMQPLPPLPPPSQDTAPPPAAPASGRENK